MVGCWGRHSVLVLTMLIAPWTAGALTGDITRDPAEVVRKYAQLDYKGARLAAQSRQVMYPYIDWTDEPVWGSVVVIDEYTVLEQTKDWDIVDMTEVVIPVEYRVLGTMYWETATFHEEPRVERIGFRIKGRTMRWRIVAPQVPPHVGLKRAINLVRQAILEEADPKRQARLTGLLNELDQTR
jgi:hypothetical protein